MLNNAIILQLLNKKNVFVERLYACYAVPESNVKRLCAGYNVARVSTQLFLRVHPVEPLSYYTYSLFSSYNLTYMFSPKG